MPAPIERTRMEFGALIDKLDDLVSSAKTSRRGREARLDREEALALVRQLRGGIPEELTQARWISDNRDEMLAEARGEIERILEEAREERARLLGADEIAGAAERRAQEILVEAANRENEISLAAEDYAFEILDGLERHMTKLADVVARGRDRLAERRTPPAPDEGHEQRPAGRPVEHEAALVA